MPLPPLAPVAPAPPKPTVFVVEDSEVHAKFLQQALVQTGRPPQVKVFKDAETAWPVISDLQRQPRANWPRLVLVDLQLPNASGIELLERIRRNAAYSDWPVVILTSSHQEADIGAARGAKASAYFVKPIDVQGWAKLAQDIVDLWIPLGAS